MINVDFKMFLDRPNVMRRVVAKQKRVLFKAGNYGMSTMRNQMRPAGKKDATSKPGEPPRTRGERLLKKKIYFDVDIDAETVAIGPMLLSTAKKTIAMGGMPIPQLLNEGGAARVTFPDGNKKIVEYLPRPFVDPVRPTVEDFYRKKIEETPL